MVRPCQLACPRMVSRRGGSQLCRSQLWCFLLGCITTLLGFQLFRGPYREAEVPKATSLRVQASRVGVPVASRFKLVSAHRHHLQLLLEALGTLGLREYGTPGASWRQARHTEKFSLLWSFGYTQHSALGPLMAHHRVNHMPATQGITVKARLWGSYKMQRDELQRAGVDVERLHSFVPRQLLLPSELNELRALLQAPQKTRSRWLVKQSTHRGIRMVHNMADVRIALHSASVAHRTLFAARFVEPLLIDNRKFDVGMYVLVTSVDPLRLWIHHNVLLRFCKLPFPRGFNGIDSSTPTDAYVVNDYLPPWEMPSLRSSFTPERGGVPRDTSQGANALDAVSRFIAHAHNPRSAHDKEDVDATGLRSKLHRAVILAVHSALPAMRAGALRTSTQHGRTAFFELLRFDFSIDAQGQPWLMEVNMSPNLMPKSFASGNDAGLKRSVVRGVLRVVGVGEAGHEHTNHVGRVPTAQSSGKSAAAGSSGGRCDKRLCFTAKAKRTSAQPVTLLTSAVARHEHCDVSAVLRPSCWGCRACFNAAEERTLRNFATEMQRGRGGDFKLIYPPDAQSWGELQLEPLASVFSRSGSRLDMALRTAIRHNDTLMLGLRDAK